MDTEYPKHNLQIQTLCRCVSMFDYMSNNKTNFTYLYLPTAVFIAQR